MRRIHKARLGGRRVSGSERSGSPIRRLDETPSHPRILLPTRANRGVNRPAPTAPVPPRTYERIERRTLFPGVLAPMPITCALRAWFLGAQCKMTASAFSSPMRSFLRYDVFHVVSHGVLTLAHRTRPPSMIFMSAARGTAISAGGLSALLFPLLVFIIGHRCKLVKFSREKRMDFSFRVTECSPVRGIRLYPCPSASSSSVISRRNCMSVFSSS